MSANTVSFLTIKRIYFMSHDIQMFKFKNAEHAVFNNILNAHLLNALQATCTLTSGFFERNASVFESDLKESLASTVANTTLFTQAVYSGYVEYIKKTREARQDMIGASLLRTGINLPRTCALASLIITESLKNQLDLITPDDLPALAEYVVKVILHNLTHKNIRKYLLPDTTNLQIAATTFCVGCLLSTFIKPNIAKIKFSKTTSEGLLFRAGIKYQLGAEMAHVVAPGMRIAKYRSREMSPEIFGLYISTCTFRTHTNHHMSKCRSNLSEPVFKALAIDHTALGMQGRLEITDVPAYTNSKGLPAKTLERTTCFSFILAFFNYIETLIMGAKPSKLSTDKKIDTKIDVVDYAEGTSAGHQPIKTEGDSPRTLKKKLENRGAVVADPKDTDMIGFLDFNEVFPEIKEDKRVQGKYMFFRDSKSTPIDRVKNIDEEPTSPRPGAHT